MYQTTYYRPKVIIYIDNNFIVKDQPKLPKEETLEKYEGVY